MGVEEAHWSHLFVVEGQLMDWEVHLEVAGVQPFLDRITVEKECGHGVGESIIKVCGSMKCHTRRAICRITISFKLMGTGPRQPVD